jgi:hypothetical protein
LSAFPIVVDVVVVVVVGIIDCYCDVLFDQFTNISPSLIAFTDKEPKDFMVPSRWGTVSIRVTRQEFNDPR